MMWKLLIAAILFTAVPVDGNDAFRMTVTPTLASEPALIRVNVLVEPDEENRSIQITAESESFFRSSEMELQGARASRTAQFQYRDLPAGNYVVRGILLDREGRTRGTTTFQITVTP